MSDKWNYGYNLSNCYTNNNITFTTIDSEVGYSPVGYAAPGIYYQTKDAFDDYYRYLGEM